jgi:ADP-ribose pyrophosphatase YjhB (NUDIX family)
MVVAGALENLYNVLNKGWESMSGLKQFPAHIVAVYGIVTNDSNQVLLLKHRGRGVWMFPGGQVEIGENLIDALLREAKEESGMEITVGRLYCLSSNTGTYQGYNGYGLISTKVVMGFVCSYVGGDFRESDETTEAVWVHKDEVLGKLVSPDSIEKYEAYLSFNGEVKYLEYVSRPEFVLKTERFI